MKQYIIAGLLAALFVWISVIALIPSTDAYAIDNPLWNGMTIASNELKLKYISINDLNNLSNNTVIFLIGPYRAPTDNEIEILKNYVYNGGYLIIMDEYGYTNNLIRSLGLDAKITGELLRDPFYKWRSSALPVVNAYVNNTLLKIYLNYASTIQHNGGTTIASSSYFSYLDINNNGVHDANEPAGSMDIVVLYNNVKKGKVCIVSDSDVLINAMIGLGDNLILIKSLIPKNTRLYILKDFILTGIYTTLRSNIISFYTFMFYSSLRYPTIIILLIASYLTGEALYRRLSLLFKVKYKYIDITHIVKKHPGWDEKILEKISKEVNENEPGK